MSTKGRPGRAPALAAGWATIAVAICSSLWAQNPASPPAQSPVGGRGGGMGRGAYPPRPAAAPEVVERGKGLYTVNCAFCHGSDARGGEGGPNLLRSQSLLDDLQGEKIAPVVQNGRPDGGMPKFDLTTAQISDIAAFLHSFPVGGRDAARQTPLNVVVGDAKAGMEFFGARCASCHSASGDLKSIASRIEDPKTLQQTWIMPNGGGRGGRGASTVTVPPTTVTVTLASGQKVEGRLGRIDDFLVTLTEADGRLRSFPRTGDQPHVEVHEPMQPHLDLLPVYTDKEIHDVTAYLVTLK
jgi:cytochrome c oxidase cbb3-type subunit III